MDFFGIFVAALGTYLPFDFDPFGRRKSGDPGDHEQIDIYPYLNDRIEEVSVSGESGANARPCHFEWILDLRRQCIEQNVPFHFHQTGANFIKDGRLYRIKRKDQLNQAKKAGIDYRVGERFTYETASILD